MVQPGAGAETVLEIEKKKLDDKEKKKIRAKKFKFKRAEKKKKTRINDIRVKNTTKNT